MAKEQYFRDYWALSRNEFPGHYAQNACKVTLKQFCRPPNANTFAIHEGVGALLIERAAQAQG